MSRDALVVGISSYSNPSLHGLTTPHQDAEAMARRLAVEGGFQVKRLPEIKNKDADAKRYPLRVGQTTPVMLSTLEAAIEDLFLPEGRSIPDTALFYFSGHGLRKGGRLSEGFLATSDTNSSTGNWGLRMKWLRELLQASPVRQQIIWLDCCYSGELLNFSEADPGERGNCRDRCFIAASREFEVAYEAIGDSYSVLTQALLQGLDPTRCAERWLNNYDLVAFLNEHLTAIPQRPIFTNVGEPILLTRSQTKATAQINTSSQEICPYRGLSYFDSTEEDAKYFFGRQRLTDELLDKIRQGDFLAIVGASGSGKSSVLRAGLLYQLKQGLRISGSDQWNIYILQPGKHPLQNLALAFVDITLPMLGRAKQLADAEELIAQGASGLRRLVQSASHRVILVVDQFEEVFTLCQDLNERQQFFATLLGALEQVPEHLCLVLAMRADFFGKCLDQDYSGLANRIKQTMVPVTPMSNNELTQAILEPAKQVNLIVEPALVDEIIHDVAQAPGSLPLVQYTLTELWKQRQGNQLQLSIYVKLGRVMGTLQQRATQVYDSFEPDEEFSKEKQQAAVRHIFLALTQLGEGTEDTRRWVVQSELISSQYPETLINRVIQRLTNEKLIVTSELISKSGNAEHLAIVDVAHEALIRHWSLLRQWLDESRDLIHQQRKIEAAAEEWRYHNKRRSYLLQGQQLQTALSFRKRAADASPLSSLANQFVTKSRQQERLSWSVLASLLIIPLFAVESFFREETVRQYYGQLDSLGGKEERQAVLTLVQGCQEITSWSSLQRVLGERIFGYCRSLSARSLEKADLHVADLRKVDLSQAFLLQADLSNSQLRDSYLRAVDLNGALLNGADLRNADLREAKLSNTNFSGANLNGADFSGSVFDKTSFDGADLSKANLSNIRSRSVSFKKTYLVGSDLRGIEGLLRWGINDLREANLSGANLSSTELPSRKTGYLIGAKYSDMSTSPKICAKLTLPYPCPTIFPDNFNPKTHGMVLVTDKDIPVITTDTLTPITTAAQPTTPTNPQPTPTTSDPRRQLLQTDYGLTVLDNCPPVRSSLVVVVFPDQAQPSQEYVYCANANRVVTAGDYVYNQASNQLERATKTEQCAVSLDGVCLVR